MVMRIDRFHPMILRIQFNDRNGPNKFPVDRPQSIGGIYPNILNERKKELRYLSAAAASGPAFEQS